MKAFILLIAALLMANSVMAQDLLVKRNGEQMRVRVLKITKKKVKFVRQGTELPLYTLPISDIEYIEYPMGDRDTFGRDVKPALGCSNYLFLLLFEYVKKSHLALQIKFLKSQLPMDNN